MASCRRQTDAFKCLKAYSKCLGPLSKQVLIAMVNSRQKYNKRICSERPAEAASRLFEFAQCINKSAQSFEKSLQAELSAILTGEAIVGARIESAQERIKHSCCSVAKVRKDFLEATQPACEQHAQVASEMIDSYLAETVGIICPDFEDHKRQDCEKLPKLAIPKTSTARFFVRPILNVIQTLA